MATWWTVKGRVLLRRSPLGILDGLREDFPDAVAVEGEGGEVLRWDLDLYFGERAELDAFLKDAFEEWSHILVEDATLTIDSYDNGDGRVPRMSVATRTKTIAARSKA